MSPYSINGIKKLNLLKKKIKVSNRSKRKIFQFKTAFFIGKRQDVSFANAFLIKALDLNIKNDLQYKKVS